MFSTDVSFRLTGTTIPADHGYHLYSAVSKVMPEIHDNEEIGIHPINGKIAGNRLMTITDRSRLIIRLPSELIKLVLPLAGKVLSLEKNDIRAGVPQTLALKPVARLHSRLVLIKGFMDPEPFLEAVQRQLDALNIKGKPLLVEQAKVVKANEDKTTGSHSPYLRRTMRIHDKEVVGFALKVEQLTAEESIRLQEKGLGGRRRFGCGIFIPDRT